jgi:hypothetical protein
MFKKDCAATSVYKFNREMYPSFPSLLVAFPKLYFIIYRKQIITRLIILFKLKPRREEEEREEEEGGLLFFLIIF